jgi:hypothetical protein
MRIRDPAPRLRTLAIGREGIEAISGVYIELVNACFQTIRILKRSDARQTLIKKIPHERRIAETLAYMRQREPVARKLTQHKRNRRWELGYHGKQCRSRIRMAQNLSYDYLF